MRRGIHDGNMNLLFTTVAFSKNKYFVVIMVKDIFIKGEKLLRTWAKRSLSDELGV